MHICIHIYIHKVLPIVYYSFYLVITSYPKSSSGFLNAAQSLRQERKSQNSRNSKNDRKGRNRHNQQRKKKNNDSSSRSRSNNQHKSHKPSTNKPIKNDKKEWPTLAEASKVERRKKRPFFGKMGPYKQRREERFETVEIKNYDKSETNNSDQQSEYKNCTRYARCSEPNRRKWEQFRKR